MVLCSLCLILWNLNQCLAIDNKLIPIFAHNICTPPSQQLITQSNKPTERTSTKAKKNKVQAQKPTPPPKTFQVLGSIVPIRCSLVYLHERKGS